MNRVLLILLVLFPACLYGQDKRSKAGIDSLTKALSTASQDTNRVNMLNDLAFNINQTDPELGIKYAGEALTLSQKLAWQHGIAASLFSLAGNYQSKTLYPLALENYFKALKMYEEQNNKERICKTLGNIGTLYFAAESYKDALMYDSMALAIAVALDDKAAIARNTGNLGGVYDQMGDTAKALKYMQLALKSNQERNYKKGMSTNYTNIGGLYFRAKAFRRALDNHFKSLALDREMDNKMGIELSLSNIGSVYAQLVKDSAIKTKPDELISASKKINLERALDYLSQAKVIAGEIGDLQGLMSIARNIYRTYKIEGNYKEALFAYQEYIDINDSIYSNKNLLKIADLETKREADLKNKQIEINKLATMQKRNERIIYGAGILVLLLIIFAVYRRSRTQQYINSIQQEALQQKEMLMREIHHRVKNNLQVISALLDLQLTNVTDDHAKDAITESTTRLKAISLIHHQLYQDKDITTIECSHFASDLHAQINAVFSKPDQQVALHKEMPELPLDIDTAVPLGLILNELMTNSYKYAFGSGGNGTIAIKLEIAGENIYRLSYRDSGPGMPATQEITTSKGLGLNIIRSLSKQLAGSFNYDRKTRSFVVVFKDIAGRKMID